MTCSKKRYRSRREAIAAALRSSASFGKGVRIYPCSECHALHLTTKTKTRNRRRNQ